MRRPEAIKPQPSPPRNSNRSSLDVRSKTAELVEATDDEREREKTKTSILEKRRRQTMSRGKHALLTACAYNALNILTHALLKRNTCNESIARRFFTTKIAAGSEDFKD